MNRSINIISILLLFVSFGASSQDYPKFKNYVNDYGSIINTQNERALNQKLAAFEKQTGTQIAVLTISSLGGSSIELYANNVFNTWGIGQKGHENGVLLLVSKNDRKLKIEVGPGLGGNLTAGESGRIIRNVILPRFKQGDFDLGIVQGVQSIQDEVQGFVGLPEDSSDDSFYTFLKFGLFGLLIILAFVLWKRYQRYKPRRSKKTGERMTRLEEDEEDEFLIESEQFEEKIGAKDYDVWVTADRGDYEVVSYNSALSGYTHCPSCGTKAQKETSNEILQSATYSRSGKGVSVKTCSFCKHVEKEHYRIARKTRSSSTYRGGGFSGGGGGFSRGGGGFSGGGGGFSGGGGASGSW